MRTPRRISRSHVLRALMVLTGVACLPALGVSFAQAAPRATQTIAAGRAHTCALMRDGSVRCWGLGYFGQLGTGSVENLMDQPGERPSVVPLGGEAVSITAGAFHTCALMTTGVVRCWGDGVSGQLGSGSQDDLMDRPGQEPSTVALGARVVAVSAGIWHTCALLVTGRVRCWGHAMEGAVGSGATANLMDEPGEPASIVPLGGRAIAVSAGGFHSCALLATGVVRCWGLGVSGQLGSGSTRNLMDQPGERPSTVRLGERAVAISSAAAHTCAILASGALQCWGNDDLKQLGPAARGRRMDAPGEHPARVPLGARVLSLAAGGDAQHACAVIAGGRVRCWGFDSAGQVGSGSRRQAIGITAVPLGARAAGVVVGEAHSCAVLVTGVVRCWGRGADGALGSGGTRNRMSAPGQTPSTVLQGVRLPTAAG